MSKSLTYTELKRVRKANELKEKCRKDPNKYKLAYFHGADLVLLKKKLSGWEIVDRTGTWFIFDDEILTN